MTGRAIARDARMIEDGRKKSRRIMAEVTILGGGHMVYRRIFTGGVYTIVAAFAANSNTFVIERPGGEVSGVSIGARGKVGQ